MQLKELLQGIQQQEIDFDCEIKGLTLNSQKVKPQYAFFAIKGHLQDGRQYLQQAIENQASVILAESMGLKAYLSNLTTPESQRPPIIAIDQIQEKVGFIASRFYCKGLENTFNVGITGTNGKTTSCFLLAQALQRLNVKSALMGTLGYGLLSGPMTSQGLTTSDAISVQSQYSKLIQQGAQVTVLEASSHGLVQHRLNGLNIDSAIFTNLSQDHLDYHKNMEDYLAAKLLLFKRPELKRAIINVDADCFDKVLRSVNPNCEIYLYGLKKPNISRRHYPAETSFVYARSYQMLNHGIVAHVVTPWGEGELRSSLLGDFNLSNLLAVLTELCAQGYPLPAVLNALYHAQGAPGRMERLGRGDLPEVIIDYAHTPDALEKALIASRQHCKRRLWCVFGCGGGRDQEKREKMGAIAARFADKLIITNDNPRMEPPRKIINDIMQGIPIEKHEKVLIEQDRKSAIEYAISHALAVDTILIAGKGHERDQDFGTNKVPFSDLECVKTIFSQGVS